MYIFDILLNFIQWFVKLDIWGNISLHGFKKTVAQTRRYQSQLWSHINDFCFIQTLNIFYQ